MSALACWEPFRIESRIVQQANADGRGTLRPSYLLGFTALRISVTTVWPGLLEGSTRSK